jgi:type VI secretion system protein ImpG
MDPRLLRYYNQELQHLREMGAEFATQFPKIAGRLGMDGIEVADPYVERMIEGFAFLAARVQLKIEAEFPRFTARLLEIVYPGYLAPTPSMLVSRFFPDLSDGNLAKGFSIPRGSNLIGETGKGDTAACQFRTAHDVTLWPLDLVAAQYFSFASDLPLSTTSVGGKVKGGLRLKLRTTAGLKFSDLALDQLCLHLSGSEDVAYKLYELVQGACIGVGVAPLERPVPWMEILPARMVRGVGFEDSEALLPTNLRSFQGYRLVQEYFSFPQRFLFFNIDGLGSSLRRHSGNELEVILLFDKGNAILESVVDARNVLLHCTPAINLLDRRCDRIHVTQGSSSYHVVPDRTKPMDFEVFEVTSVTGHGIGSTGERTFLPLYSAFHSDDVEHNAYFTVQREPRLLSSTQKQEGARSSYLGSEVFVSLVDRDEAPFSDELRQLAVTALCTNRDLPIQMPLGTGRTDFVLDVAAPVQSIRAVAGPSRPSSASREGNVAWKMIDQLSLNYLSLMDIGAGKAVTAIREMLALHVGGGDGAMRKQVEGLRSVRVQPTVRRLPHPGMITFGRGLRIELEVDELAFAGGSAFLFGSVMEQFFSRYVSINSFTETLLRSTSRGEIMRWVPRCGERPIL